MLIAPSAHRVATSTPSKINRRIEHEIALSVERCMREPARIDGRLVELDREWDVERVLQANASALALTGLGLGTFVHRGFYGLSAAVLAFLFQHAIQGWCPPLPVLRRMGVRTAREIEAERHALKALRGDYDEVCDSDNPVAAALEAVNRLHEVPNTRHENRRHSHM